MKLRFSIVSVVSLAGLVPIVAAQTITKCQDAEGNWHYGNYASEKCADGPITELRESGVTLEVREAPPTIEELQAEKARKEAERDALIRREEKLRVDRALLAKYPSEQVIVELREQRVSELEKQIQFNDDQLAKLRAELDARPQTDSEYAAQETHELRQQIERFERAIDRGRAALESVRSDYSKLLERYRAIDPAVIEQSTE